MNLVQNIIKCILVWDNLEVLSTFRSVCIKNFLWVLGYFVSKSTFPKLFSLCFYPVCLNNWWRSIVLKWEPVWDDPTAKSSNFLHLLPTELASGIMCYRFILWQQVQELGSALMVMACILWWQLSYCIRDEYIMLMVLWPSRCSFFWHNLSVRWLLLLLVNGWYCLFSHLPDKFYCITICQ